MNPCIKEEVIEIIKDDVKVIKADVKSLLQFKWQIMGGAAFGGFLIGTFLNFILNVIRIK